MAAANEPQIIARHRPHPLDVAEQRLGRRAVVDVPFLDGVVQTARDEYRRRSSILADRAQIFLLSTVWFVVVVVTVVVVIVITVIVVVIIIISSSSTLSFIRMAET